MFFLLWEHRHDHKCGRLIARLCLVGVGVPSLMLSRGVSPTSQVQAVHTDHSVHVAGPQYATFPSCQEPAMCYANLRKSNRITYAKIL